MIKRLEFTWQAVLVSVLVAALVAASYPYVVLKLGLGPNISVVSAFVGALLLLVLAPRTHGQNRWMNNLVQTAGTSASATAFLCIIAAAFDMTAANPTMTPEKLNGIRHIDPWPMFLWLSCAGGIGVLLTVLVRRHFVDDPKMVFADGVAAAETILILDTRGEAGAKLRVLGLGAVLSAAVDFLREGVDLITEHVNADWLKKLGLPDWYFGTDVCRSFRVGVEWNLLSLGSGLLVGLNVSLSMLAASVLVGFVGPWLIQQGVGKEIVLANLAPDRRDEAARLIDRYEGQPGPAALTAAEAEFVAATGGKLGAYLKRDYFGVVLLWLMWPATALMITASVTAVLLKWRSIVDSFARLRAAAGAKPDDPTNDDVSVRTVVAGSLLLTVGLAWVQSANFGVSYFQTVVAVACSLPLMLVGVRVLGETNQGPISVMMNGLQAVFAGLWPGNVGHNLIAAGMTGSCNAQAENTIQDYKAGKLIGSTPRLLTWVQLAAVPVGAAAVAVMYPLLRQHYGIGDGKLTAPPAVKISNMAVLLAQGVGALPTGALLWTVIAAVAGVVLTVVKDHFGHEWVPSVAGFGFGLILPGTLNIVMGVGGILGWVWELTDKPSYDRYAVTVAAGLIGGEAIVGGLVLPVAAVALPWLVGA